MTYCPECLEDVSLDGDYCDICGQRMIAGDPIHPEPEKEPTLRRRPHANDAYHPGA